MALFALVGLTRSALALDSYDFSYTGRLLQLDGKPVAGPVALRVDFYHSATNGTPVLTIVDGLQSVTLQEGIFQIKLALTPAHYGVVFSNPEQPTYIQITDLTTAPDKPYERQEILMVPYAAKVPVDNRTIAFGSDGKLGIAATPVAGKFLRAASDGSLVWDDVATTTTSINRSGDTNVGSIALGAGKTFGLGVYSADPVGLGANDAGKMWFNNATYEIRYWDGATVKSLGIANAGSGGTVTSIAAGTGLTGGTITSSGTIAVDVGTESGKIVQAGANGLPAIGGSQLTGLSPMQLDGNIDQTEFGYLDGLTGNIQTQVAALQPALTSSSNISVNNITSAGTSTFAGNVGIGTTSPTSRLSVQSSGLSGNGSSGVYIDTGMTNTSGASLYGLYSRATANTTVGGGNPAAIFSSMTVNGTTKPAGAHALIVATNHTASSGTLPSQTEILTGPAVFSTAPLRRISITSGLVVRILAPGHRWPVSMDCTLITRSTALEPITGITLLRSQTVAAWPRRPQFRFH